jgi:excisionase family DNA binding protein
VKTNRDVVVPPTLPPTHPEYGLERYRLEQAARYLRRSVRSLQQDVAKRRIAFRRDGRRLWFSQADLDAWREAHRVELSPRAVATVSSGPILHALPPVARRRFS